MIAGDLRDLCDRLIYCPETGIFRWRSTLSSKQVGGVQAGALRPDGYWMIADGKGRQHPAHRIAWAMVNGAMPDGDIDHMNRLRGDNRIANLRVATRSQNNFNSTQRSDNASGYRGVSYFKRIGRWRADVALGNGKRKYLGSFGTKEAAAAAYDLAAREIHGEFYTSDAAIANLPARDINPEPRREANKFLSVGDIEKAMGFGRQVLARRLERGWSLRDALLTPQGSERKLNS